MYRNYSDNLYLPSWLIPKALLIMKLTMVLFIATTMQVSATGFAQKITIKKNDISLETPLNEVLRKSFENQALLYGAENRTIIIAKLKGFD